MISIFVNEILDVSPELQNLSHAIHETEELHLPKNQHNIPSNVMYEVDLDKVLLSSKHLI